MSASLSLPLFDRPAWRAPAAKAQRPRRVPRYYQRDAHAQTLTDLQVHRSTLLVMATGTGKTFTMSSVIKDWRAPVLWLNERDNLVTQVRDELEDLLGEDVYIEQAELRAPSHARVVVASLQSMCQPARLARFPRDRFSLIVPDEAHHSVSASYRRIFDHFEGAKIAGLTATPDRLDEQAMGIVYEAQSADYQMHQGVADGYLVRPELRRGKLIDVSRIRSRGEFSDDQIAEVLGDDVLKAVVEETLQHFEERRGVLYFPRVDIAHVAARLFNAARPGIAAAVDGSQDLDLKRSILRGHKAGDFLLLCNVGVVEEGHDDSGIAFVGMVRPIKSRAKYTQWIGRGTRPNCDVDSFDTPAARRAAIAASGKPFVLVQDFVGNSGKHELVSIVDALAGRHDTDEVRRRARDILEERGGGDVEDAIATARRMDEAERRAEADRVSRVQAARFEWKVVNPFEALGIEGQTDVATALNRASEKQRNFLRHAGVTVTPSLTSDDAQRLIRTVKVRERKGLANFHQIRSLSKVGVPAQQMYFDTARRVLAAVAANGSRPLKPEHLEAIIATGRTPGAEG